MKTSLAFLSGVGVCVGLLFLLGAALSPTKALPDRDVYYPGSEDLAKDEMRIVALGTGMPSARPKQAAACWLAELGNPYARIGADTSGRVGIEWGVYGLPETFVIDKQGRIRYRHVGPLDARTLERTIRPMLRELGK